MVKKPKFSFLIFRNPLLIPLLIAFIAIAYFFGKNQNLVSNTNIKLLPTPTIASPTITPSITNSYQIPTTSTKNQGLSVEDRQKLGSYKAQIEEVFRKTKEQEDALRNQIDEARKQCDDYANTKDQCLASVKELEDKLTSMIKANEESAYPLRQKLAEINAMLGASN